MRKILIAIIASIVVIGKADALTTQEVYDWHVYGQYLALEEPEQIAFMVGFMAYIVFLAGQDVMLGQVHIDGYDLALELFNYYNELL